MIYDHRSGSGSAQQKRSSYALNFYCFSGAKNAPADE